MNAFYHSKYAFGRTRPPKKKSGIYRIIKYILLIIVIIGLGIGYYIYQAMFTPNTWTPGDEPVSVYIEPGDTFDDITKKIYSKGLVVNRYTFEWLAKRKDYPGNVKIGHYLIEEDMTNNELLNILRAGMQTPVDVIFHNINTLPELSENISDQLVFDSIDLMNKLNDTAYLSQLGFDTTTVKAMFIPNTYELYWTATPEKYLERMKKEYENFWNEKRIQKAEKIDFTPFEVSVLASIIEKETNKNDEKSTIAGVYINRLERGYKLQADPTLKYAMNDFSIRRVLNRHKKIDSPYNTYKYSGLPPGPICLPSISSLEAVLNYEDHKFYYFVAKPDFSGYHSFSRTYKEHLNKAREYQQALNKKKIYN
ncbi:MAG: endolytic transglycosylase MltG [Bacteroidales bacterium]|nr:endolytic transglycosylase MltG [Bacteroidales bacterium]MCF8333392.1 endolytic transglycosylase MltG [Bacteroidales bacterium]